MPSFAFKYQIVLADRERKEDDCQRRLAQLLRQQMILEDQLRALQQSVRDARHALAGSLVGRVDLGQVSQFARYSGHAGQRGQVIAQRLARLEQEIAAAREALMQATRARKALELLRDRQRRAWLEREARLEDARLDELAVQRFAHLVPDA